MDDREKLVGLLIEGHKNYLYYDQIADYLIANGVTVQRWIPVTERLPEREGRYLCVKRIGKSGAVYVTMMNGDGYGFSMEHIYTDDVTHWMPLPEPPKEEAKEPVPCSERKHRMWSDHYAECSKGHKGIVRPDDTCPYGERRSDGR